MNVESLTVVDVVNLIQGAGLWVVFAYMFLMKDRELKAAREEHMNDLREIASIRPMLKKEQPPAQTGG